MNIKKVAPIITTRVTQLLERGEVVESKIRTGMEPKFYTALPSKDQFQALIPNLKQTKMINYEPVLNEITPFSDTYTVHDKNLIHKLILNYKKHTASCVTTVLNKNGEPIKKLSAKIKDYTLRRGIITGKAFDSFVDVFREAPKMFITYLNKGKAVTSYVSYAPAKNGQRRLRDYYMVKGKFTQKALEQKNAMKNAIPKSWYEPIDTGILPGGKTFAMTIVRRPTKSGHIVRVVLKKGMQPQIESFPNKSAIDFKNGIPALAETREIYPLPFENKHAKAFDIITLKDTNSKIKIIKDYITQIIKLLMTTLDEKQKPVENITFFIKPKYKLQNTKPSPESVRDIINMIDDCRDYHLVNYVTGENVYNGKSIKIQPSLHKNTINPKHSKSMGSSSI